MTGKVKLEIKDSLAEIVMPKYPKINALYKRDPKTGKFLSEWARPEFPYLFWNQWRFEEKVDGTNIRVGYIPGFGIHIKGRREGSQIPPALYQVLENTFSPLVPRLAEDFEYGVCFYGEGYGPKIEKGGGNYRDDLGFVVFDIRIDRYWLRRGDVEDICESLGLDVVPIIGEGGLGDAEVMVTKGFNSSWGDFLAEGLVCKPKVTLHNHMGRRIITKIKHCDYLREDN